MSDTALYSVTDHDIWELVPWHMLILVMIFAIFPLLLGPMFRRNRSEHSSGMALGAGLVIMAIGLCVHFYMTRSTFQDQQQILKDGTFEVVNGPFQGIVAQDLIVARFVSGIMVGERLLEAPGGLYGMWSDRPLPLGLRVGDEIEVAVAHGIYLQVIVK